MFKLIGQVMEVEVDQPSRISIKDGMILVIPLSHVAPKSKLTPIQENLCLDIGEQVMKEVPRLSVGRKPNPESALGKVKAMCSQLQAEGMSDYLIRSKMVEKLKGFKSDKTLTTYFYVWRAAQKAA